MYGQALGVITPGHVSPQSAVKANAGNQQYQLVDSPRALTKKELAVCLN